MATASRKNARTWHVRLLPFFTVLLLAMPAAQGASGTQIWSVIIPDAFPGIVYTWRFQDNGTYTEDGRDARTNQSVQPTMNGHWRRNGTHMTVQQDGREFLFEGLVSGTFYGGTLYRLGQKISPFCAVKGPEPARFCDPKLTS